MQIYDTSLTFNRLVDPDAATAPGAPFTTSTTAERLTTDLKPKMIQDEMGEAFEHEYGRMSGFLGVETPNAQAGLQNMILYPYTFPPTEVLDGIELPPGVEATPIASAADGTQIWKFTHNGVDTHPIHFHLYDVQLLNRVGWDGIIRKPDATELGWKDTVRVSPLEDTIVAVRPIIPPIPEEWNGLPNSIRLLDPSMPAGEMLADTTAQEAAGLPIFAFNPDGEPIDVKNHYVNFGWEYVLHCHILSHEEMDMMRSQAVAGEPGGPDLHLRGALRNGPEPSVRGQLDGQLEERDGLRHRAASGEVDGSVDPAPWSRPSNASTRRPSRRDDDHGHGHRPGPVRRPDRQHEHPVRVPGVRDQHGRGHMGLLEPGVQQPRAGGGFPTTVDSRGTGQVAGDPVDAPTALTGTRRPSRTRRPPR